MDLNHTCDSYCDPEDGNHKELRKKMRARAMVKANFKADQAWAHAREAIVPLTQVREKIRNMSLDEQQILHTEELEVIDMALTLILGELYLRKADSY